MPIDTSLVSIGEATKKSHHDQCIDNDKILNSSIIDLETWNRGLMRLSLTNFNNTGTSSIASGSIIHVHDSVFEITATLAITNWSNILTGTVFIMLKQSGDYLTSEYTATSPTWNGAKQGYYGTGTNANHRFAGGMYKAKSGTATIKYIYGGKGYTGTWRKINNPPTGALASLTSWGSTDSFTDGNEVTFDNLPAGTKAVKCHLRISGASGWTFWRKSGDTNISNTPIASLEYANMLLYLANSAMQAEIWLSSDYKAQFAVADLSIDMYISYPYAYLI